MSWDSNFGVSIGQAMVQGAAEGAAVEFKYTEAVGVARDSHIAPLKQLSKTAGNFGTFYTIADKGIVTINAALIQEDYQKAIKEGTLLAGYAMAAYMMAAPTGITQIVGGVMFLGLGIYDLLDD
jgi:hypothetical protein